MPTGVRSRLKSLHQIGAATSPPLAVHDLAALGRAHASPKTDLADVFDLACLAWVVHEGKPASNRVETSPTG